MTRAETLLSKHEEISRCVKARESLLREIWRTSSILSIIKNPSQNGLDDGSDPLQGEDSFLEANNIFKDRFFDISTLPNSQKSPQSRGQNDTNTVNKAFRPDVVIRELENNVTGKKGKNATRPKDTLKPIDSPLEHFRGVNSGEDLQEGVESETAVKSPVRLPFDQWNSAKSTQDHGLSTDPGVQERLLDRDGVNLESNNQPAAEITPGPRDPEEATRENGADSSQPIPPLATDGDSLSKVTTIETKTSDSVTVQVHSKYTQEGQLEERVTGDRIASKQLVNPLNQIRTSSQETSATTLSEELSSVENAKQAQSSLSKDLDLDHPTNTTESSKLQPLSGRSEIDLNGSFGPPNLSLDPLKPQMVLASTESAVLNAVSTPDTQLRLEEARSLQLNEGTLDQLKQHGSRSSPPSPKGDHGPAEANLEEVKNDSDQAAAATASLPPGHTIGFSDIVPMEVDPADHDFRPESSALRDHAYPSLGSKDVTLSQRPPMHIDMELPTNIQSPTSINNNQKKTITPVAVNSVPPQNSTTSVRSTQKTPRAQSPPERMTTRVSSGALSYKPVSKILGETPKVFPAQGDKNNVCRGHGDTHRDDIGVQSPRLSLSNASPDPAAFRIRLNELREKEKSKLSTVVFARQQLPKASQESFQPQDQAATQSENEGDEEYLMPLFKHEAMSQCRYQPLSRLLSSASKILTTADQYTEWYEHQNLRILSDIKERQDSDRWSLRQLERSAEPDRPVVHWDVLLGQMKWLRTDFREERKWKLAAAKSLANWCAEWVASSPEGRSALQIKAQSSALELSSTYHTTPTPELIPSAEDDASEVADEDRLPSVTPQSSVPAAIFSLTLDMFYFGLEQTPSTTKLLEELPLYQPSVEIQDAALRLRTVETDSEWKASLVPVSRYAEGKLRSHDDGPPRKRSRYDYDSDSREHFFKDEVTFTPDYTTHNHRLEQASVALFDRENKHIRDRIHAGHAFRPPSEYVMPSQGFFESRQPSQWTQEEDDELRKLVREYAYNWSLISGCLSMPSTFSSGSERRTPWECFERWIGLEGLPAEMSKTHYFRAYHSRLQAAQRTFEAQQQALQQHQSGSVPYAAPRRRSRQPYLVERRRNDKHVHLVSSMHKVAKKREAALNKQQQVAGLAAMRKATEVAQTRPTMRTPQEFSRLKHEREIKVQEQAKAYRLQYLAQQKAAVAQRAGQHSVAANIMQSGRVPIPVTANGLGPTNHSLAPNPSGAGLGNQANPVAVSRQPHNVQANGSISSNHQGVPHAPMQAAHMHAPPRIPPPMGSDNMRIYQEVSRVQAEQQRYLQQQRQQIHSQANGHNSPSIGSMTLGPQTNSTNLSNLQGRSSSPSINGTSALSGSSSSPQMTNLAQPQALSSGMMPAVNQIASQIKARNPQASPEQISQMTTDRLNQYRLAHGHVQAHAAAMQAAAGGSTSTVSNNLQVPSQPSHPAAIANGSQMSQQHYAQMMRSQQSSQQNRNGTSINGQRPASRSVTPQIHRTPSAQGHQPSASPRLSQLPVAGGP
ncbi:MAG: hypothetical protein Q9167_000775 [Letrouitia subvulpina]